MHGEKFYTIVSGHRKGQHGHHLPQGERLLGKTRWAETQLKYFIGDGKAEKLANMNRVDVPTLPGRPIWVPKEV